MSLSDAMGAAGLALYAQAGLVISFAAFVAVAIRTLLRSRDEMEERARSVLEDGPAEGSGISGRNGRG
jgi:hypothetical protein